MVRRAAPRLNSSSLDHSTDINARMPREEAEAIFNLIKPVGECSVDDLPPPVYSARGSAEHRPEAVYRDYGKLPSVCYPRQTLFRLVFPDANVSRGKADCGDIDILITRPTDDGKTHAGTSHHSITQSCTRSFW